jgi:L,D-transpeptidase ErfK/SrfK
LVYEDTFAKVAREEGVGYEGLRRLNLDVDEWLPDVGTTVTLPTALLLPAGPRRGVVINLSEFRLYFFDTAMQQVHVYPIGIGEQGSETPLMQTRTVSKIEYPAWYPPASVRAKHEARGDILPAVVWPGPENPLGRYAIKLAEPGYFIHGTNQPIGVGRRISAGCIRLYARHIAALVSSLPNGTEVRVVSDSYKVAWHDGELYLEAHAGPLETGQNRTELVRQVIRATESRPAQIDWDLAMSVVREATGLPVRISL